jgi:hypothetical protein
MRRCRDCGAGSHISPYGGGTSRTWRKVIWENNRAFVRAWLAA